MSEKLFAGYAVRRLRRRMALTQASMAAALDISPSYLNLIERNQRPLSGQVLLKLAEHFDIDPRLLGRDEPAGGIDGLRKRLGDPQFADLAIDRTDIEEWLAAAPQGAEAFARLYDRTVALGSSADSAGNEDDSGALVRREIERWRNHFADLDSLAETLADSLRLSSADISAAITDRLRANHQLSVRILPYDVMPDAMRRLDLHARQVQLSELLNAESRVFQLATVLAQLEARDEIDALVRSGGFAEKVTARLFRRHLNHYTAAAIIMPYGRFLRACEQTGYDFAVLQRRFNVSFEQMAHRLTTLQRVGARGIPFFMLRFDQAGQVSKRYAGASNTPLLDNDFRCPLWNIHAVFGSGPGLLVDRVTLDDQDEWISFAMTTMQRRGPAREKTARFAIVLGCRASDSGPIRPDILAAAPLPTPIGLGCAQCHRTNCVQRSLPPRGRMLTIDEREQSASPFNFRAD